MITHMKFSTMGLIVASLAGAGGILAGPGVRLGWWHYSFGLKMVLGAAICALISIAISLIAVFTENESGSRNRLTLPVLGIVMGLAVSAVPLNWIITARSAPRIHDITTDMTDPPRYVAILAVRVGATNPVEYGGLSISKQQTASYPEVAPIMLPLPVEKAYERAMDAAHRMRWTVVDGNPHEGRIEATDTTFWFGFKDDIVVRIRPEENGSRVDVRSLSRVGLGDLGTNAKRIVSYLTTLKSS